MALTEKSIEEAKKLKLGASKIADEMDEIEDAEETYLVKKGII